MEIVCRFLTIHRWFQSLLKHCIFFPQTQTQEICPENRQHSLSSTRSGLTQGLIEPNLTSKRRDIMADIRDQGIHSLCLPYTFLCIPPWASPFESDLQWSASFEENSFFWIQYLWLDKFFAKLQYKHFNQRLSSAYLIPKFAKKIPRGDHKVLSKCGFV